MKKYAISERAFNIIDNSESIEGFEYAPTNVESNNEEILKNITKEVVLEFLKFDDTKVWAVKNENGEYDIIAYNLTSREKVRVTGLGNHFVALVKIVKEAEKRVNNPTLPLIKESFIKDINLQILLHREGEVGIGEYRYLDCWNRPIKIGFGMIVDGQKVRTGKCVELESSVDKNIYKKMSELTKWVNEEAFQNDDTIMEDIAKFHARFLKIHPFCDGNGRTSRLITNYLLLTQGLNMINIPAEVKNKYVLCLNYANATSNEAFVNEGEEYKEFFEKAKKKYGERNEDNKYLPLTDLFKKYSIEHSNDLINEILNYKGSNLRHFSASQI